MWPGGTQSHRLGDCLRASRPALASPPSLLSHSPATLPADHGVVRSPQPRPWATVGSVRDRRSAQGLRKRGRSRAGCWIGRAGELRRVVGALLLVTFAEVLLDTAFLHLEALPVVCDLYREGSRMSGLRRFPLGTNLRSDRRIADAQLLPTYRPYRPRQRGQRPRLLLGRVLRSEPRTAARADRGTGAAVIMSGERPPQNAEPS